MAKRPRAKIVKWPLCWCAFSLLPVLFPLPVPQAQEQPASERHVSEFRGLTMGGTFSVKIVTAKDELETPGLHDVDRALRSSLDRIEGLMSTWDPDSELSRFNRSTSLEPFTVAPETFEVFTWSVDVGVLPAARSTSRSDRWLTPGVSDPAVPGKRCRRTTRSTGCERRWARAGWSSIRRP